MKYNKIKDLSHFYLFGVMVESIITGILFFLLPTILVVTLYVNIISLYMPYFLLAYMGLYIIIYSFIRLGLHFMMKTFKVFGNKAELNYNEITNKLAMILGSSTIGIFVLIYWIIFY